MLYKILQDGKSCHGGNLTWPLPTAEGPGEWVEVVGDLVPCAHGLHLATEIGAWYKWGAQLYEAETRGVVVPCSNHKVVVNQARLLREIPPPDYIAAAVQFVASISNVQWFSASTPAPEWWVVSDTRAAAYEAARAAARAASRDASYTAARAAARAAAYEAAYAAASMAGCIVAFHGTDNEHFAYARRRWAVWQAGYGLAADTSGVFYVYKRL